MTYHKHKDKCRIEGSHDYGPREGEEKRGRSDPVEIRALREAMSRQSEEPVANDITGYCMLELINTSAGVIEIGKNVKLGEGKPLKLSSDEVVRENVRANTHRGCRGVNTVESVNRPNVGDDASSQVILRDALKEKLKHLSSTERAELVPVINEYSDLFRYDRSGMLPCTNKGFHEIKTGDAAPIKKNPYKVPFALKDEVKKQLDDMLQRGVITPACSEWAAPIILVKKVFGLYSEIQILY